MLTNVEEAHSDGNFIVIHRPKSLEKLVWFLESVAQHCHRVDSTFRGEPPAKNTAQVNNSNFFYRGFLFACCLITLVVIQMINFVANLVYVTAASVWAARYVCLSYCWYFRLYLSHCPSFLLATVSFAVEVP